VREATTNLSRFLKRWQGIGHNTGGNLSQQKKGHIFHCVRRGVRSIQVYKFVGSFWQGIENRRVALGEVTVRWRSERTEENEQLANCSRDLG
jgi:hypothetical protein